LPLSEKLQLGVPGMLPDPVAVIATVVPLSCPDAWPEIAMSPAQVPENVPEIDVAVCELTS
jgi:hypothetical protein